MYFPKWKEAVCLNSFARLSWKLLLDSTVHRRKVRRLLLRPVFLGKKLKQLRLLDSRSLLHSWPQLLHQDLWDQPTLNYQPTEPLSLQMQCQRGSSANWKTGDSLTTPKGRAQAVCNTIHTRHLIRGPSCACGPSENACIWLTVVRNHFRRYLQPGGCKLDTNTS